MRFVFYCVFSTIQNSIVHCIAEGAKDNIEKTEKTEKGCEHLTYKMEGGSCGRTHLQASDYSGGSDMSEWQDGGEAKASKPYIVDGKKYKMKFGSRRQVFNGTAYQTKGNLKQNDIKKNKQDRFVSVKKSLMATKEQRLLKYGYGAKKGKFGYVRVKPVRTAKRKRSASARKKSAAASAAPVAASAAVADAAEGETERVSPLASRRVGIVRRMKRTKRKTKRKAKRRQRGTKRKGASRGIKKGSKGRR